MKRWQIVLVVALVVGLAGGFAYWQFTRHDDRFGDPQVLEQIRSSTDCNELQRWADAVLIAHTDKAVGYSNAAGDRMKQLGCR